MQENILSKRLNLGLNFSTPSGGVTSPSLKGSRPYSVTVILYSLHYSVTVIAHVTVLPYSVTVTPYGV